MVHFFKQHRWVHFSVMSAMLLAMLIPTTGSTVLAQTNCGTSYTVVSGDTLGGIAYNCGVSLAALELANPQVSNFSLIYPGEVFTLPTSAVIPITGGPSVVLSPAEGIAGTTVVVAGTGWTAGSALSVTVNAQGSSSVVSTANANAEANRRLSTLVTIPASAAVGSVYVVTVSSQKSGGPSVSTNFTVVTPPPPGPYSIASGDTLVSIAKHFGTTVIALIDANSSLTSSSTLTAGQQIYIPGSTVTINGQTVYIVKPGDFLSAIAIQLNTTTAALLAANPSITNSSLIYSGEHLILPGGTIPVTGSAGVQLSPVSGEEGVSVTMTGAGFPANTSLNITAGPQGAAAAITQSITTDSNGKFSLSLVIPSSAQNGTWVFKAATTASGSPSANANFQVGQITSSSGAYTVVSGDTLLDIAIRFDTSINALLLANPQITNANIISPGEVIYLPGATATINGKEVYFVKSGDTMVSIANNQGVSLSALEAANSQITDPALIFPGERINLP